jgi:hypothetical protein
LKLSETNFLKNQRSNFDMPKIQKKEKAEPFLPLPFRLESFFCFKASSGSVEPSL